MCTNTNEANSVLACRDDFDTAVCWDKRLRKCSWPQRNTVWCLFGKNTPCSLSVLLSHGTCSYRYLQIFSQVDKFFTPQFAMIFSTRFLPYTDSHSKPPLYYTTLHRNNHNLRLQNRRELHLLFAKHKRKLAFLTPSIWNSTLWESLDDSM
jgi:hypothetical protein